MRLAKYLASAGIASRRKAEEIIAARRVVVNSKICTDPALDVDPHDVVIVDGVNVSISTAAERTYIVFNKPVGVVTTMDIGKEKGIPLSYYFDPSTRIFPVGRLDRESSGLLIMTNDGEFAYRLTHPKYNIEKEYEVKLDKPLTDRHIKLMQHKIVVEDRAVIVHDLRQKTTNKWSIVIHEGRKRIVRRLFEQLKINVLELKRVRIGPIMLGRLSVGHWKNMTPEEINSLRAAINL